MKRICISLILVCLATLTCLADYTMNTASKVEFLAWDTANNVPKTGDAAQIAAYVRIDGGTLTQLADTSATELSSTNAPGVYEFDVAAAETNGDHLLFTAKSSTANISLSPLSVNTKAPLRSGGSVVDASPAPTTTTFAATGLPSTVTDFYMGDAVVFTSGALAKQSGQIYSYAGPTTKLITLQSALTAAPTAGDTFVIVKTASSRKLATIISAADATGNVGAMLKGVATTTLPAEGTAGNYAGSFGSMFNVAAADRHLTVGSVNQTGDAYLDTHTDGVKVGSYATGKDPNTYLTGQGYTKARASLLRSKTIGSSAMLTVDVNDVDGGRWHSTTPGRLAANLTTMFDVATQSLTGASTNQTADVVTQIPHPLVMTQVGGTTWMPEVDTRAFLGTASAGTAGYAGLDWGHVNAPTTTVGLTGTTVGTVTAATVAGYGTGQDPNTYLTGQKFTKTLATNLGTTNTTVAKVGTMLTASGGNYTYTVDALKNGPLSDTGITTDDFWKSLYTGDSGGAPWPRNSMGWDLRIFLFK
jgi:hypothetical protein